MDRTKESILKTIIYSDIFDYSLTAHEIDTYLIQPPKKLQMPIQEKLAEIAEVEKIGKYYVLRNRKNLIPMRSARAEYSQEKIKRAQHIGQLLIKIPTVFFIGISGGVAMHNAEENDDIDFFVIVKKNTVWITRLLLLFFLEVTGNRRRRHQTHISNTICLNMLIDEQSLKTSDKRQELYTAHEIVQMLPLYDKYGIYKRFLFANAWVKQYLPNAYTQHREYIKREKRSFISLLGEWIISLWIVEYIARITQEMIMRSHRTSEIISKTVLAFHPMNYREKTLAMYNRKVKKYVSV